MTTKMFPTAVEDPRVADGVTYAGQRLPDPRPAEPDPNASAAPTADEQLSAMLTGKQLRDIARMRAVIAHQHKLKPVFRGTLTRGEAARLGDSAERAYQRDIALIEAELASVTPPRSLNELCSRTGLRAGRVKLISERRVRAYERVEATRRAEQAQGVPDPDDR